MAKQKKENTLVKIDWDKLVQKLKDRGTKLQRASVDIGRNHDYLGLKRRSDSPLRYKDITALFHTYGIKLEDIQPDKRSRATADVLINYKELIEYAWNYAMKNCLNVYSISKNATYRSDPEKHFSAPYMRNSYQGIQEGKQTCFDLGLIDYLCRTYNDFDPPRSLGYEPPVIEETDSPEESANASKEDEKAIMQCLTAMVNYQIDGSVDHLKEARDKLTNKDEPVEIDWDAPFPGETIANPAAESEEKAEEDENPNLIHVVVSDQTLGALRELGKKLNMGVTVLASELLADKVAVIIVDYHNKKRAEALLK